MDATQQRIAFNYLSKNCLLRNPVIFCAVEQMPECPDRWTIKNTSGNIVLTHTDSYSVSSFPGVKRPEREGGQKCLLLCSRMSLDIFNFSVCFHGVEKKCLICRGSGCTSYRSPEPSGVLNAFLFSGPSDCKGQLSCAICAMFTKHWPTALGSHHFLTVFLPHWL